jgi:preprotein translocase subunit SecA
MLNSLIRLVGGDPNRRDIEHYIELVDEINALEAEHQALSDEALRSKTDSFRRRLDDGETLDDLLPEAFAAVREASRRTIGLRHYDVQLIGGMVLHLGSVAEMRTGEGKTLVATLPLYLNALSGKGAHLVTVNDYLARRDARWMAPIYAALGLTVGVLQEAARTDNARKAFVVDPARESTQEDADKLRLVDRRLAYAADITYGTNHEFGFDYLRDNLAMRREERVQRVRNFAIVDEVDNILIDEARTPLIISGPSAGEQQEYKRMAQAVRQLRPEDYEINERDRTVNLTEAGEIHIEGILGEPLRDPDRPEDVTPEQARLTGFLTQALRAELLFRRNRDYLVQGGQVVIVDEFTGRLMHGRRWSDGLHQAVEAKEGLEVQPENVTYATITLQNYFRLYAKLSGMTGTALTEAEEFHKIYNLDVTPIPTNLEYLAHRPDTDLVERPFKEEGNKFFFFARKDEPETPVFWRRKDYKDVIYRTEEAKHRSVCTEIMQMHVLGRPVLMGTTSVERSEILSERLRAEPLRKLALTLIVRDAWFQAHKMEEDGRLVEELAPLAQPLGSLSTAALRSVSKPLEVPLNPEDESNLERLLRLLGLPAEAKPRLLQVLQKGIPHQVLNAKKHAEESQIIAGAGAFGAVTIATNMAGRGVDIKLGGDLAEEVLAAINRVLRRTGVDDPYNLTNAERLEKFEGAAPEQIGIYTSEADYFRKHMREERKVRELGGLHVLGSERHEARRIDNQLRGRAARQGDPGSSRFFLSMEDDLMRRFGGEQVAGMMQTMRIDDAVPMESGLVSRMIEQAQSRVEGANFDVRKHLLEYDDVLNKQRAKVYEMRERIFDKEDLREDIEAMLAEDIRLHVETARREKADPWKLLAWLEDVQPTMRFGDGTIRLSFPRRIILEELLAEPAARRFDRLIELTGEALSEEENHLRTAFDRQMDLIADRAKDWARENREAVDMAWEGAEIEAREKGGDLTPPAILNAVARTVPVDARAIPRELLAPDRAHDLREELRDQFEDAAWTRAAAQASAWLQRRTGLPPEKSAADEDFDETAGRLRAQLDKALGDRRVRIVREVTEQIRAAPSEGAGENELARLLMTVTLKTTTIFDQRSHQRRAVSTAQFSWVYLAAQLSGGEGSDGGEALAERIREYLLETLDAMRAEWGRQIWVRVGEQTFAAQPAEFQKSMRANIPGPWQELDLEAPLRQWPDWARLRAIEMAGDRVITQAHRDLMLGVLGQSWVEYLTEMEGLRTSVGLEAYAQRDPLVQYKSKAFDLFRNLMQQVRTGVVSRLFRMSLRTAAPAPDGARAAVPAAAAEPAPSPSSGEERPPEQAVGKKRKRHRH